MLYEANLDVPGGTIFIAKNFSPHISPVGLAPLVEDPQEIWQDLIRYMDNLPVP